MRGYDSGASAVASSAWACKRCGCYEEQPCKIEITVVRPDGERAMLLEEKCDWSAPGLCTACDERLLPELKSLLGVWRQLGAIAMAYRDA